MRACLQSVARRAPAIFRETALDTHAKVPAENWGPRYMPEPKDPNRYRESFSAQGRLAANSQKAAQILAERTTHKAELAGAYSSVFKPTPQQQPACSVVSRAIGLAHACIHVQKVGLLVINTCRLSMMAFLMLRAAEPSPHLIRLCHAGRACSILARVRHVFVAALPTVLDRSPGGG